MSPATEAALDAALDAIRSGPEGPQIAAFFDLGGTVLADPETGDRGALSEHEFGALTEARLADWVGRPEEDLLAASARAFRKGGAAAIAYETWNLAKAHQRRGHTVVLLSPATRDRALPVAREFDIEHVLCTPLRTADGILTGELDGRPVYGPGKVAAAEAFAAEHGIDLAASHAYTDGAEDVGLLELVGHPTAVNPDARLGDLASGREWPVLHIADRAAGAVGTLRTIASYGGFFASTGVGIAAGLLGRRRRLGVDTATALYGELGPLIAGIKLDVQGEENVWAQRPAIFAVNHQSHLVDAIVTFKLLRSGFTVVAKKQAADIPGIGQALQLADWAFVDRVGDRAQARAAIQHAVDKLDAGVSIIIAPEGTRSIGPRLGEFKKGAFFMAREAGVPVVPVIMRNSGELMWRNGKALRGGTVDVLVHPPIWCGDWTDEELGERVAEVRQIYVDALEDWPRR